MSILFSCKVLSNSSSFSPSPLTLQVAYLNHNTFSISERSLWNNPVRLLLVRLASSLNFPRMGYEPRAGLSSVVGLLPLASGHEYFEMAFPAFLINKSYTSVTRSSLPRLWEKRR